MRRSTAVVVVLSATSAACAVAAAVLLALTFGADLPDAWGFRGFPVVLAGVFTGVGAVLAARRPTNAIGWILLGTGVLAALQGLAEQYSVEGNVGRTVPLAGAMFAAWFQSWIWVSGTSLCVVYAPLVFPDGRVVSPRWRLVGYFAAIGIVLGSAGLAFQPGPLNTAKYADNPFAVSGPDWSAVFVVGLGLVTVASVSAALSLIVRYRRAQGVERQQLKWLAVAGVVMALTLFPSGLFSDVKAMSLVFLLGVVLLPISIGIAVVRYRLYDIDVLINRALVYGATTAAIGAAFFAGIVVLQAILRPITSGSEVAVAISTLASVALFQPLRARVQNAVDRRFYRSRYDAQQIVETFASGLRDEVDLDDVQTQLLSAVHATVQPRGASVWLRSR